MKLKKSIPIIISILIFFITIIILTYSFEVFKSRKNSATKKTKQYQYLTTGNDVLLPGYSEFTWFIPGSRIQENLDVNNVRKLETIYNISPLGYRTGDNDLKKGSKHLIAAGCSYTFGESLPFESTISALSQEKMPMFNSYNLGFIGGGLNTALRYSEVVNMKDYVHEDNGIFIYVFIEDHLARWFGKPSYLYWAGPDYPFYHIKDGKPVYVGKIGNQDFYKEFQRIKNLNLSNAYLHIKGSEAENPQWTEIELEIFFKAILTLKKNYSSSFPKGRFYWLIHPLVYTDSSVVEELKQTAHKNNVEVLDTRADFQKIILENKLTHEDLYEKYDGHPSAIVNQFISQWLFKHLDLKSL